jgi:protease I
MSRQTTSVLKALLNVEASASVPKLSNAQMLDAPENSAIRDTWVLLPDNPNRYAGRKVAVVATGGVEEIELT